jgi:chromate transporter
MRALNKSIGQTSPMPPASDATTEDSVPVLRLRDAARVWARIGLLSFGGPAGQIALMHRVLVQEKQWIGETRFLAALNYCMLLPGPEATQLAVYIGWLLHRIRGGLVAGLLFLLPGVLVLLILSSVYVTFGRLPVIAALFYGVKPAVLAIVMDALLRIARRALQNTAKRSIAALAFLALQLFHVAFPFLVLTAGAIGALRPRQILDGGIQGNDNSDLALIDRLIDSGNLTHLQPGWRHQLVVLVLGLLLWVSPVLLTGILRGTDSLVFQQGVFFSQVAVLSFGGAYAVLAYVAQHAVENLHWLSAAQMLDGLALAETTPGPLILVLQFVAFVAAWSQPQDLPVVGAALWAAALALWVTFVPCFLWIFLGAPYVERLQRFTRWRAALGAITAAVVGVIANLSIWFAVHVLFCASSPLRLGPILLDWPDWRSLDPIVLGLMLLSLLAMLRWRLGMGWTLAGSALLGLAAQVL